MVRQGCAANQEDIPDPVTLGSRVLPLFLCPTACIGLLLSFNVGNPRGFQPGSCCGMLNTLSWHSCLGGLVDAGHDLGPCLAAGAVVRRCREAAWAAAQVLCVLPIVTNAVLCDQRLAPYLQRWGEHVSSVMSATLALDNPSSSGSSSYGLEVANGAAATPHTDGVFSMLRQLVAAAATATTGDWQQQGMWVGSVCSTLVVPAAPMRALWACHGELAVVALLPLVQPLRLRWYLPGALLEVLCVAYAFSLLYPLQQVVLRFATALCAAVVVACYTDRHYRTTFVRSTGSSHRACCA